MTCWQYQTNFAKHSVKLQEAHGPHHSSEKKSRRCRFSNFVYVFSVHCNNLPSKSAWFLIWINLNPLHPQILCAKFGWYWPSGSGEVDFKILSMYFRYFIIIPPSPLEKGVALHLNNLNPLHPRSLIEISPVVLEKKMKMW